ncbi:hypothetical protein FACS1894132_08760 [Clostridia bacterium]|nr:hypothetical protein FACS1894132_08760 [Clostridia bacterium]
MRKLFVVIFLMLMFTACNPPSYDDLYNDNGANSVPSIGTVPTFSDYPLMGGLGFLMENDFFKYKVNETDLHYEINGHIPENENLSLLRVNMTVINKSNDSIPIGAGEFPLDIGGELAKPIVDITNDQFPVNYQLPVGGTLTGDLFYKVPYGQTDFAVEYTEIIMVNGVSKKGEIYTVLLSPNLQNGLERAGDVRKHNTIYDYELFSVNNVVKTKFFNYSVNSYQITENILEVKFTILTDVVYDQKVKLLKKDWALYYNGELFYCIDDSEYMLATQTLSPNLSYEFKLGFQLPVDNNLEKNAILEYTEYDLDKVETKVYGVGFTVKS